MTPARALTPPPAPASHTLATTPRRARLLDELDAAIEIKANALALAEQGLATRVGTADEWTRAGAVADLRAGLEELRRLRGRAA